MKLDFCFNLHNAERRKTDTSSAFQCLSFFTATTISVLNKQTFFCSPIIIILFVLFFFWHFSLSLKETEINGKCLCYILMLCKAKNDRRKSTSFLDKEKNVEVKKM